MPDRRVLVTGGTGFIGVNLVNRLLAHGDEVHVATRTDRTRTTDSAEGRARFHRCDLLDRRSVGVLVAETRPHAIVHLASAPPHARTAPERRTSLEVSTLGALHLREAAVDTAVTHLVVGGSSLVYQTDTADMPLREGRRVAPTTFRGLTKACEELIFAQASVEFGLPVTILRILNVYGPWEPRHRLIPTLLRAARNSRPVRLTARTVAHDFIHVDDVCAAIAAALDRPATGEARRLNIGTGLSTTNTELVDIARRVTGAALEVGDEPYPETPFSPAEWAASSERAHAALGWRAGVDLEEGLQSTWTWFAEHPDFWDAAPSVGSTP